VVLGSGLGAFVMRGAGCAWNDITDRKIDAEVARTRSRPLPSGQLGVPQAIGFMVLLGFTGLGILVTFHELGHYVAARWCGVKVLRFSVGFGAPLWKRTLGADGTVRFWS
jgi:4-hydroxybenzoate polyprenyltransferase